MSFLREPAVVIVILVVVVLLFFSPKLPALARSLGQSFRIIKSEVHQSQRDNSPARGGASASPPQGQDLGRDDSASADGRAEWPLPAEGTTPPSDSPRP